MTIPGGHGQAQAMITEALLDFLQKEYGATYHMLGKTMAMAGICHCKISLYEEKVVIADWLGRFPDSELQYDDPNFFSELDTAVKAIQYTRQPPCLLRETILDHLQDSYSGTTVIDGYSCRLRTLHCTIVLHDEYATVEAWFGTHNRTLGYERPDFFEQLHSTIRRVDENSNRILLQLG